MGKIYECVREFSLDAYSDEGFYLNGTITVEKGSKWEVNNRTKIIGGEIHLDCLDDTQWIEIGKKRLEKYFRKV